METKKEESKIPAKDESKVPTKKVEEKKKGKLESYYNEYGFGHIKEVLYSEGGWILKEDTKATFVIPGQDSTLIYKAGFFIIDKLCDLSPKIYPGMKYTAFDLLAGLWFQGNNELAELCVTNKFLKKDVGLYRIGTKFYKTSLDDNVVEWNRPNIKEDEEERTGVILSGKKEIKLMSKLIKLDGFTFCPDNKSLSRVYRGVQYNKYIPFRHKPRKGSWNYTRKLLEQVFGSHDKFGSHYKLGLEYLQVLYQDPMQRLPIPSLVSKENNTGKSTFGDYLEALFTGNCITMNPDDLNNNFNAFYLNKIIVNLEESKTKRTDTVSKLKTITTMLKGRSEEKYEKATNTPIYTKFTITSNHPTKFIRLEEAETRFWIHVLKKLVDLDVYFLQKCIAEIPAFLYYLDTLPRLKPRHRLYFTPEETYTPEQKALKLQSRDKPVRDFEDKIRELFYGVEEIESFSATLGDINNVFFKGSGSTSDIRDILEELKVELDPRILAGKKTVKYIAFKGLGIKQHDVSTFSKPGRTYVFKRELFA